MATADNRTLDEGDIHGDIHDVLCNDRRRIDPPPRDKHRKAPEPDQSQSAYVSLH